MEMQMEIFSHIFVPITQKLGQLGQSKSFFFLANPNLINSYLSICGQYLDKILRKCKFFSYAVHKQTRPTDKDGRTGGRTDGETTIIT